jgi:hypothetical protein
MLIANSSFTRLPGRNLDGDAAPIDGFLVLSRM